MNDEKGKLQFKTVVYGISICELLTILLIYFILPLSHLPDSLFLQGLQMVPTQYMQ